VTTCEGQTVKPELESWATEHIQRRQRHSSMEVSVAWLEAPEGSQLLLVERRFLHLAAAGFLSRKDAYSGEGEG
jgi:primosomal replication protein N